MYKRQTLSQPNAEPTFCYRITQSGLRRAADQGIDALRILAFLQDRCSEPLPASVVSGLQRWQNQSTPAREPRIGGDADRKGDGAKL